MEVTGVVFVAKTWEVIALEVPDRSGNQYGNEALCLWSHLFQPNKCSCLNTYKEPQLKVKVTSVTLCFEQMLFKSDLICKTQIQKFKFTFS